MIEDKRHLRYRTNGKLVSLGKVILFFWVLCIIGFLHRNVEAQEFRYRTDYGYDGEFGRFGIADTAACYDSGTLIARAKAIRIIEKTPGPNHIEVKETHYDATGTLIYEGIMVFQFGFGGGHIVSESPLSGKKRRQIFNGWPAGH